MAWSSLQPQALRLWQRTRARRQQSLTPTWVSPDQFRATNTARRRNEAARPHPPSRFPAPVAPTPTSAADRNPHSRRLCPAGSFLGDFRTPAGARNSSRLRTVRFWPENGKSRRPVATAFQVATRLSNETMFSSVRPQRNHARCASTARCSQHWIRYHFMSRRVRMADPWRSDRSRQGWIPSAWAWRRSRHRGDRRSRACRW